MMDLGWQAWLTLGVVMAMLVVFVRELLRPDLAALGALVLLLFCGVVSPEQAFAGFANTAVLTVAALFIIAAGVQRTGALGFMDRLLFPRSPNVPMAVSRLMSVTALLSGFLNNTPLVAMLIPRVQRWADQHNVPASKLLIPLSHAAVLGGTITLIGTSTNLLVAGLMTASGLEPLGLFDLAWVGIPISIAGVVYFGLIGHRLLPGRMKKSGTLEDGLLECMFELRVSRGSVLAGQSVEDAELRALGDTYLAHVRRGETLLSASPELILQERDVLAFVGRLNAMERLLRMPGLERVLPELEEKGQYTFPLYEAVVAPSSRLVGHTLRDVNFREEYHGIVLGIQRRDEQLTSSLGRTPLKAGDLLLVEASNGFDAQWNARRDEFYLVAPRRSERAKPLPRKAPIALALLFSVVVVGAFELVPLVTLAFAAAILMLLTGCLNESEARRSLDIPVLVVIAASLGIGRAVEVSGLAGAIASQVVSLSSSLGPVAVLVVVYLVTNLLTELITNNAAAVLMLPIGIAAAQHLGVDPKAFAAAVAVAASAGFMTPIGYQTNLMVMSAGGYRFTDFFRVGVGLNLICLVISVVVISFVWL